MKHSLELVAQIACNLILSILLSKCVSYDLRTHITLPHEESLFAFHDSWRSMITPK